MAVSTRIYGGGAIAFGGQPVINDLQSAGYDTVIMWSVHVVGADHTSNGIQYYKGDLILNNTRIVSRGVYSEQETMNLPANLASLRQGGKVKILFSVGAGGPTIHDWANIQALMGKDPGPTNILYKNFKALLEAMAAVEGGGIDGVDYDNEDNLNTDVMVEFGQMLARIGYPHVTLCPYMATNVWVDTVSQLDAEFGAGFVSAIHLQCYSGGAGNTPLDWINAFNAKMGSGFDAASLMMPGLSTAQSSSEGRWWVEKTKTKPAAPGACVKKEAAVAQFDDLSRYLKTKSNTTPEKAMQIAQGDGAVTFFFYCKEELQIGEHTYIAAKDALFFTGAPTWGSAPHCDGYYLDCDCSGSLGWNPPLCADGCPALLEKQYKAWNTGDPKTTPGGGFIWMYDSVLNCLTSSCCGGTPSKPVATATAYREAITTGLT